MADHALIAVNAHRFHAAAGIARCLHSVAEARRRVPPGAVPEVRVFCDSAATRARIAPAADCAGFATAIRPGPDNAARLNAQIRAAHGMGAGILFRVDADDTVAPDRFRLQLERMRHSPAVILGGALRYVDPSGADYIVRPPERPRLRDFLLNRAVLHPAMALRVPAVMAAGLRYPPGRLEDKALISRAIRMGLAIENLPAVLGDYRLGPSARDGVPMAARNLALNIRHLGAIRRPDALPLALAVFAAGAVLPNRRLRQVRQRL